MLSIDPKELSERETYKLLIGSIIPRPIAFITSLSKENIVNAAPFSYFNIVCANPPLISVAINRVHGRHKDTARNILERKEFVVHIVDEAIIHEVNETAAKLPPEENELEHTKLTTIASKTVTVPSVKEAKVRFECRLEKHLPIGEVGAVVSTDLIIGRVQQILVDESIYYNGKIDPRALNAVSRLAGASYATIGEIFNIPRPN